MRIFDCIFYAGERDLLNARVEHLSDIPDLKHVIVEGTHTFTGQPRAVERPKVERGFNYVVELGGMPGETAWNREYKQRGACTQALLEAGAEKNDMVLLADVDEFPAIECLAASRPAAFEAQSILYYLNGWQVHNGYGLFSVWAPFSLVESHNPVRLRHDRYRMQEFGGVNLAKAGWHFTYQGSAENIRNKLRAFSHQELCTPETLAPGYVEDCMASGMWIAQNKKEKPWVQYVPLESFAPLAILRLAERRPDLVHPVVTHV